jgi:hypothetical protein
MVEIWTPEMRIDGKLIQEKARKLAREYGVEGFEASDGWLTNFKRRFQIEWKTIYGESESVDPSVVEDWKEKLAKIINDYQASDIFNGDEFGLFFQCLPNNSMLLKGQSCKGGKQSKTRITVFVCCNMDGSEKVKLSVIGKSANPRAFKKTVKQPIDYFSNNKSWMNTDIFYKIMSKLNSQFSRQGRKVLIFLDNFSCHTKVGNFSNIKLVMLPKNTTSLLQPCDAGIIRWIKRNYRQRLTRLLLAKIEKKEKEVKINLQEAVNMLNSSWKKLPSVVIINCFKKFGFQSSTDDIDMIEDDNEEEDEDLDLVWEEVKKQFNLQELSFQNFIEFDDDLVVTETPTEKSIADRIFGFEEQVIEDDDNDGDTTHQSAQEEEEEEIEMPNLSQVLTSLSSINLYASSICDDHEKLGEINDLTDWFIKMTLKKRNQQSKITDYFFKK